MWPRSFCQLLSTFFFFRTLQTHSYQPCVIDQNVRAFDIWMCEEERGRRINDKPKIYHQRNTNTRSHACKKKNSEKKKQQNNELSIYLSIWFGPTLCACLAIDTALPIIHLCSCDMWHCGDGVSIFISLSRVSECIELSASISTFKIFDSLISKFLLFFIRWFLSGFVINHWLHIFEPLYYITGSGEFQMIFFLFASNTKQTNEAIRWRKSLSLPVFTEIIWSEPDSP